MFYLFKLHFSILNKIKKVFLAASTTQLSRHLISIKLVSRKKKDLHKWQAFNYKPSPSGWHFININPCLKIIHFFRKVNCIQTHYPSSVLNVLSFHEFVKPKLQILMNKKSNTTTNCNYIMRTCTKTWNKHFCVLFNSENRISRTFTERTFQTWDKFWSKPLKFCLLSNAKRAVAETLLIKILNQQYFFFSQSAFLSYKSSWKNVTYNVTRYNVTIW